MLLGSRLLPLALTQFWRSLFCTQTDWQNRTTGEEDAAVTHDQWMPPFVPAPTPTPTAEPRPTRTYETGDAVPAEQVETLDHAALTERALGSLAAAIYVPETRATARREEEVYQAGIKQRREEEEVYQAGNALSPDAIHQRARAAGSLAL